VRPGADARAGAAADAGAATADVTADLAAVLAQGDDPQAADRFTHGFHSYPARMHPGIAAEALARFGREGSRVLDPFCGSGTVLVEAMVRGLHATGVDLSPLATRLAALRCELRDRKERDRFVATLDQVTAASLERVQGRVKARAPLTAQERSFYAPHVLLELAGLREEIRLVEPVQDRRALLLVLSSLLVKLSTQRGDTSEEPIAKRLRKGLSSELFQRKGHELVERWAALYEAAGPRAPHPAIIEGDARELPRMLAKGGREARRFDLVLSSQPYGGTYDYVAHHARRYPWLGLDPSALEQGEIGARRRYASGAASGRDFDDEVRSVLTAIAAVCVPDARVLLLVGDAEIGGARIDAAEQLARLGARAGLQLVASASQPRTDFHRGADRREHLVLMRPARR
jgi:SAM-dependent methyltransferase